MTVRATAPVQLLSVTCLAAFLFATTSKPPCDTIGIKTGTCTGIVYAITLQADGKSVTYNRLQFTAFTLGADGSDSVTLKDGSAVRGKLDSLRVSSVGGLLTYKRADINSITLDPAPVDDLHKDYLQRRYTVDTNSPEDLVALAKWCLEKNLKAEEYELARMAIAVDEYSDAASEAHDLLGEVWDVDKWVPKTSVSETTEPGETTEPAAQKAASDPAAQAAIIAYRKLCTEYKGKLAGVYDKDFKAFTKRYKPPIDAAAKQMKSIQNSLVALDKAINDLENNKIPNADAYKELPALKKKLDSALRDRAAKLQSYAAAQAAQQNAIATATKARDDLDDRTKRRRQKFEDVQQNIVQMIYNGNYLSLNEMRKMLDPCLR